jgi:16S rRNA (cytidine1402-2'-O)-methyltransferase
MKNIIKSAIYIVSTPIGNLGDISKRAIEVLQQVDEIAAEDTRHSKQLLMHLGINTPLIALHEHNERAQAENLIARVKDGKAIALISDAGTPLISDPGYHLVRNAYAAGVRVIPIPGACAVTCALSVSGLATDRFCFEGFLASKASARLEQLQSLINETRTMVFYEAPHRIVATLTAMSQVFGSDRDITIARELTKQFETIYTGSLQQVLDFVQSDPQQQRGEFVLVVAGAELQSTNSEISEEVARMLQILMSQLSVKQAASLAAEISGVSKNQLYEAALRIKDSGTQNSSQ